MFEQAFRNIDDVLRKEAGCTTELDYTEQSSWLLFLKYLAGLEEDKATEAALDGKKYSYIVEKPYHWETWAAPKGRVASRTRQPWAERLYPVGVKSQAQHFRFPMSGAVGYAANVVTG